MMKNHILYNIIDIFDVGLGLYFVGSIGLLVSRYNLIGILIALEVMLLSVNYLFIMFSIYHQDAIGQLYALCVLAVAAAESSVGLSLLLIFYRVRGSVAVENVSLLKS